MSRQVAVVTGMPIPERRYMNTTVDAGLYMRLSVEDESNNESTSIQTQRAMLTDYCREKGFRIVDCYVDDGETGTNFERPEFQRMLRDIEAGKINTVICKDLSRFGRNYYEAGMYRDKYFVERKIRFIAIQDNVDSAKGSSGLTVPMINVMNDYYARSISEKTKAAKQTRAKQGMYLGSKAPYGYQKDPKDPHHLTHTLTHNSLDPSGQGITKEHLSASKSKTRKFQNFFQTAWANYSCPPTGILETK